MRVKKERGAGAAAVVVLLVFVFQQIASKAGGFVADCFDYSAIDECGVFAWISVHHVVQMLMALLAVFVLSETCGIRFGLGLGDRKRGAKYLFVFTGIVLAYTAITNALSKPPQAGYPMNAKNVIGALGFQLFLSGPSEEILFRALPISVMAHWGMSKEIKAAKWRVSVAAVIAAALFAAAHIKWTISPFTISADPFQLVYCLVLGTVYGVVFQRTKSVLYPMLMHSITNVIAVGLGFILQSRAG